MDTLETRPSARSRNIDPEEWADAQRRQSAQYFGVGMGLNVDGGMAVVDQTFPGSPALAAAW